MSTIKNKLFARIFIKIGISLLLDYFTFGAYKTMLRMTWFAVHVTRLFLFRYILKSCFSFISMQIGYKRKRKKLTKKKTAKKREKNSLFDFLFLAFSEIKNAI